MFALLNAYAWLVFALVSVAFIGGSITLAYHLRCAYSGTYAYLFVISSVTMAVGFALGGMQAGDRPFVAKELLIPWIRLYWLVGSVFGILGLTIYWLRRRRCS